MPVTKYRDVSEMPDDHWYEKGSPELLRAIQRVWDFAHKSTQPHFPPGVYKLRSVEESDQLRREWQTLNFEAHRLRKGL